MKMSKTLLFSTVLMAGATLAVGTSNANADEVYTVQSNDSLSKISNKFAGDNSLINQIAEDNNIENANIIFAGTQLTIPTDDSNSKKAPVQQEEKTEQPAQQRVQQQQVQQPAAEEQESNSNQSYSGDSSSAKEWIAQRESSGSYSATNGRYIGRYQLDASYLNGDHSQANQERVADQYVNDRYGSWAGAKTFWLSNGWY
ncbi:LysM peptidoglycan-binding domain-containing protein [Tetragenococcus muriaticus]|uniref:Aggregation promoting factor n=2 Tax=Tetragenococcus muriaticus TaxID=64642 RepID=A0A091CCC7_9ENTE|nr:LysM peptidoglycan-binding domain-containing protein [Tetragenococcus muriaticus]KFN90103.1 aggregation promoting factor [Tetragenococcus muriaticus 3MR10-3]KFN90416.1 aggregation promoting factor [Tetragenococcus muriaticus PMC-11-5]GMA47431.1 peptidase M23 [Tetragenococcus muriaticus]